MATLAERFWLRVKRSSHDRCWEWFGSFRKDGYGRLKVFRDSKWKEGLAHRVSWELTFGEIPKDPSSPFGTYYVCHRCDNKRCCNPNHLFLGSARDNSKDAGSKGRMGKVKKLTSSDVVLLREDFARGVRFKDLVSRVGLNPSCVRRILYGETWKTAGGPLVRPKTVKTKVKRAKLRPIQVLLIRELALSGITLSEISRRVGTDISNVTHIVERKTWKSLAP